MISKIDSNNNKLLAISNALIYYTGVNVKRSALGTSARYRMARYIFYKYCLEHNLSATLVADFVGASRGDVAARARLKFTKSFAKSPKNRELYMGFCSYIKELAGDTL